MQQVFEYYIVDPKTWKDMKKLNNIISSSVERDLEAATLGSASINTTESLSECYIRIYMIASQNGVTEKYPIGTFLVQTPSTDFDGKVRNDTLDAYTPLIELKEKYPPLGYAILEGTNIMEIAYNLTRENLRAPVVKVESETVLNRDFVSQVEDTWLTFNRDLLANDKKELALDELGRVLFAPKQDIASLRTAS